MSYKLLKPYTLDDRFKFVTTHSAENMRFEDSYKALYALEPWEILKGDDVIDNREEYEKELLMQAKIEKSKKLEEVREEKFNSGFIHNNVKIDCDDRSQGRLGNKLQLAKYQPEEKIEWLDFDYKPVTYTLEEFTSMCLAMQEHVQKIEFKVKYYVDAIEKAKTVEEVEEISFILD